MPDTEQREFPAELSGALERLIDGIKTAMANHKPFPSDPVRGVGIVTEEVGEAMQAALGMTRERPTATRIRLIEELTDTAAAAVLALAAQIGQRWIDAEEGR